MSTFNFKTYSSSEAISGLSGNSQVLNSSEYQILNKDQTSFIDCGLALINLKEDYLSCYRNVSNMYEFEGKNIGFAFVNMSRSAFTNAFTSEMTKKLVELCFKHNVTLTKWVDDAPHSTNNKYVESDNGESLVIEGCIFMKPSVGIKSVWHEFNLFLVDYYNRLEYILGDKLETIEKENQAIEKEKIEFDSLLTMLSE
jgi:hypothetical protein